VRDALEKSYLKTLSFAIFLDPEQPNNIVECYTSVFFFCLGIRRGLPLPLKHFRVTATTLRTPKWTFELPMVLSPKRNCRLLTSRGNIKYSTLADVASRPEMEVHDSLRGLSISKVGIATDPGGQKRPLTVAEVKRQVQNLIRQYVVRVFIKAVRGPLLTHVAVELDSLISMTQSLSDLPRQSRPPLVVADVVTEWVGEPGRRFVTVKLFYVDETPDDYEPPLFKRAEVAADRWYLNTQSVSVLVFFLALRF
jgi:hypothetical protein